jgi:deoxyribodipyrimidine photo-lyase
MGGTAIVWFRYADLRIRDHEPLLRAHRNHDKVLHLFCFDERIHGSSTCNFSKSLPEVRWPKVGYFRNKFLLESVSDLKRNLINLPTKSNSATQDLFVRTGIPELIITDIVKACGASAVYCHSPEAPEEAKVEKSVATALSSTGHCVLHSLWGNTMYHINDLPTSLLSKFPSSATQFRTLCESKSVIQLPLPAPGEHPDYPLRGPPTLPIATEVGDLPSLASLSGLSEDQFPMTDPRAVLSFQGGETAGLSRIQEYFFDKDCLQSYFSTRNGMVGPDYSSKFSPWLAAGCLSPRTIAAEVGRYEAQRLKNKDTYWMIFELTFRDYFRYYVHVHGSSVFKLWGPKGKARSTRAEPWGQNMEQLSRWTEGCTGNPFVDANMQELRRTGFMSNRGRQVVASYLTRDMGLDWRLGAMYFESMLIDHDPCLNWGNWTYAAGVGSDPREDRYFSIPKQAKTYDPQMLYMRLWLQELEMVSDSTIANRLKVGTLQHGVAAVASSAVLSSGRSGEGKKKKEFERRHQQEEEHQQQSSPAAPSEPALTNRKNSRKKEKSSKQTYIDKFLSI